MHEKKLQKHVKLLMKRNSFAVIGYHPNHFRSGFVFKSGASRIIHALKIIVN